MKALSNSHPFMLAINEERETDAKSSIPDRCWGKEVGRKKEWKLMEGKICEEEKFLKAVIP